MEFDFNAALSAYDPKDYLTVIRLALSHVQRNSLDGRAWELLGLVKAGQGRYTEAVSDFEQASLLVPLRQESRICLGYSYGKIGRTQLASDLLNALVDDDLLPVESLLQIAVALDGIGFPAQAVRACRAAVDRDSTVAQAYYDLGYYSARCGRPVEVAISMARHAISLDPFNVAFRIGLASLLCQLDRREEAYHVVQGLTDVQLECIRCHCCLERIQKLYEFCGDERRSLFCHEQLLKLEATQQSQSPEEAT